MPAEYTVLFSNCTGCAIGIGEDINWVIDVFADSESSAIELALERARVQNREAGMPPHGIRVTEAALRDLAVVMADGTPDDDGELTETLSLAYLYVNWKQATPSPSEIAALGRIDPTLRGMSLSEAAAALKDENWWRLGPFVTGEEADVLEGQLRSAGFAVQKKWQ